jgi:hypothetical protein
MNVGPGGRFGPITGAAERDDRRAHASPTSSPDVCGTEPMLDGVFLRARELLNSSVQA